MIAQAFRPALISPAEYLRREAEAKTRHEFVNGTVCEMAGASRNHGELTSALSFELRTALKGKVCRNLDQDTKVWIASKEIYYYPDATVSCPPNFIDATNGVIDNPTVVFEVPSPSTRTLDQGQKFADYRTLPTLRDYVLIDSEATKIEVFSLENGEWVVRTYVDGTAAIPSVSVGLDLSELYRHVVL